MYLVRFGAKTPFSLINEECIWVNDPSLACLPWGGLHVELVAEENAFGCHIVS